MPHFGSTYKKGGFEEDAERVVRVLPEPRVHRGPRRGAIARTIEDSTDGKARWVALHIPVTEGQRYRVGDVHRGGRLVCASGVSVVAVQDPAW